MNKKKKGTEPHLGALCAALVDAAAVIKTDTDELLPRLIRMKSHLYDDGRKKKTHTENKILKYQKRSSMIIAIFPSALMPGACDLKKIDMEKIEMTDSLIIEFNPLLVLYFRYFSGKIPNY